MKIILKYKADRDVKPKWFLYPPLQHEQAVRGENDPEDVGWFYRIPPHLFHKMLEKRIATLYEKG